MTTPPCPPSREVREQWQKRWLRGGHGPVNDRIVGKTLIPTVARHPERRGRVNSRSLQTCPLPKGYSSPASTQSFATDVKHLNHQLRHIDGSRSVAQDARVFERGLRNHMPTALDLVALRRNLMNRKQA